MNASRFRCIFIFLLIATIVGCNEDDGLPDEPVINSVDFDETSKELLFNFTDGDGNFGLERGDTLPPFQELVDTIDNEINEFHFNLWLDLFVKRNGNYELIITPGTFDFRIPLLTPTGQNKQLKVNATYDLAFDLDNLAGVNPGDTLRFDVTIVDRDLNLSNVATTDNHVLR